MEWWCSEGFAKALGNNRKAKREGCSWPQQGPGAAAQRRGSVRLCPSPEGQPWVLAVPAACQTLQGAGTKQGVYQRWLVLTGLTVIEEESHFCDCHSPLVHVLKEGLRRYTFHFSLRQKRHADCRLLARSLNSYFLPLSKSKISSRWWHVIHYHNLLLFIALIYDESRALQGFALRFREKHSLLPPAARAPQAPLPTARQEQVGLQC